MKPIVKITLLVLVLGTTALFSKSISKKIINSYKDCISFVANNTVGSSPILGI
jgi:hypothetical protein